MKTMKASSKVQKSKPFTASFQTNTQFYGKVLNKMLIQVSDFCSSKALAVGSL